MCRIKSISYLDVGFSTCSAVIFVTLALVVLGCSLAVTIATRVFLECYYVTAHLSLIMVFISGFVLSHHIGRLNDALGVTYRTNGIVQSVLNFIYWQGMLLIAISYTGLLVAGDDSSTNWDHFAGAAWAYMGVIMMSYLLLMSVSIGVDRNAAYSMDHLGHGDKMSHSPTVPVKSQHISMTNLSTISLPNDNDNDNDSYKHTQDNHNYTRPRTRDNLTLCSSTGHSVMFWCLYMIVNVFFMACLCLTEFNAIKSLVDTDRWRHTVDLYEVGVDGHRPLHLAVRCVGKGTVTLLIENELGAPTSFYTPYLPKYLSAKGYKTCVYDRRGYGWSETYEHDRMNALWDGEYQDQSVKENIRFLRKLIKMVRFNTPFYHIGHGGLGGMHVMEMIKQEGNLVAGAIFIDSQNVNSTFNQYSRERLGVMENFLHLGVRRAGRGLGMFDLEDEFEGILNVTTLTSEEEEEIFVALENGHVYSSQRREEDALVYQTTEEFAEHIYRNMSSPLSTPVLLIEPELQSGNVTNDWFPATHFPKYNSLTDRHEVLGSNHFTLMFSQDFGRQTADIINTFIRKQIGFTFA